MTRTRQCSSAMTDEMLARVRDVGWGLISYDSYDSWQSPEFRSIGPYEQFGYVTADSAAPWQWQTALLAQSSELKGGHDFVSSTKDKGVIISYVPVL